MFHNYLPVLRRPQTCISQGSCYFNHEWTHLPTRVQAQGMSQQLEANSKTVQQSISDTVARYGEDGPSNRELLHLLEQQSQLISKYQARVDHTNATLLQNQKMLQRISTKLEVCFNLQPAHIVPKNALRKLQPSSEPAVPCLLIS